MQDMISKEDEERIRHYGRHCVTLSWLDSSSPWASENEGRGRAHHVSGFIAAVRDQWYLITAGHVIQDIDAALNAGQRISGFRVNDCWGPLAQHPPQVFDYRGSPRQFLHDEDLGTDVGYVELDGNTKSRIEANGVVPLSQAAWAMKTDGFDEYFICGSPSNKQSTTPLPNGLNMIQQLAFFHLEKLNDPPAELIKPCERVFFKRPRVLQTEDGEVIDSIDGMSGSPIFGVDYAEKRYYVVAIQSGVDRATERILFGCWFLRLARALLEGQSRGAKEH